MTGGLIRFDGAVNKQGGQLVRWDGANHKIGGQLVRWDGANHKIIGAGGGAEPGPPVFVAATSQSAAGGAGVPTDATTSMPAGWAAGHLALFAAVINVSTGTFTPPTGWTALPGSPTLPAVLSSSAHWFGYRILQAGDVAPKFTGSAIASKFSAMLGVWSNAALLNQAHASESVNQASHVAPDVAVGVNDVVVRMFMEKSSTNISWTGGVTTDHTLRTQAFGTGSGACSCAMFSKAFASAGQAGTATATASTSSAGVTMASVALAGVA